MIETEMVQTESMGASEMSMVPAAAQAASRLARIGAMFLFAVLLALSGQLGITATAQESPKAPSADSRPGATTQTAPAETNGYFVTGVVTDDKTGQPIADASIQLIVPAEPNAAKRVLRGSTNADGRYRIAVPLGTVRLWYPSLKPGYWIVEPSQNMVSLTTSLGQPIASHDIRARSAPVWRAKYVGQVRAESNFIAVMELADDSLRRKVLARETWSSQTPLNQWNSLFAADGTAAFTQIGDSGKLVISAADAKAELIVDANFDNARVTSAVFDPDTKYTLMRDAEGRTARLHGATVETNDGVPTILFVPRAVESISLKIVGTALGSDAKPLPDVEVRVAIQNEVGGGVLEDRFVLTKPDGSFELQLDLPKLMQSSLHKVSANFRKAGLANTDSKQVKLSKTDTAIDVGATVLQPGHTIQLKTIDDKGQLISGAAITATTSVSQIVYQARTDANGEATLKDLPTDVVRITASHGQLTATTKLVVDNSTAKKPAEIKLIPKAPVDSSPPTSIPTPVAMGRPAPEWHVQAWTDGKSRSLAESRGRVTVLEFWGVWCGPCVTSIPSMQKLAEDYEKRGVTFVGVHTADGTIEEITKLKRLKNWSTQSAIDQGTSITDSKTAGAYGVRGYPTVVVIDADGIIRYRTDILPADTEAFMKDQRQLALANGIEWPLPENPTAAQAVEISNKMNYANIARELDRLLNKDRSPDQ